jgi:hypothetical protein
LNEINNYEWTAKRSELEAKLKSSKLINDRIDANLKDKARENENLRIALARVNKGISV